MSSEEEETRVTKRKTDKLEYVRVLNSNNKTKLIVIEARSWEDKGASCSEDNAASCSEGNTASSSENKSTSSSEDKSASWSKDKAVVIMEKTPFDHHHAEQLLSLIHQSDNSDLHCNFHNDIYSSYMIYPNRSAENMEFNAMKTTVICPATDQHIKKYSAQNIFIVLETVDIYNKITLPYILSQQFSLNWVDNILNHKSEADRIICDVHDPDIGFVLLPDMKWDGIQIDNLYLVAISRKSGIKSLRDLNDKHLPLLNNIKTKGCQAISEKYGLSSSSIRIYIHYQPSYYHLHVHFTALTYEDPGCHVERAHLLDTVINNITLCNDYYQKATLAFPIKQNHPLYSLFSNAGLL